MLKQIAIVGGALVVVGVIGLGVTARSFSFSFFPPARHDMSVDMTKTASGSGIHVVQIQCDVANIYITPSASNQISAHLYGDIVGPKSESLDFHTTTSGGELDIVIQRPRQWGIFNQSWQGGLTLDVAIPTQDYDLVGASVNAGTVSIANIHARQATLQTDAGDLSANNMTGSLNCTSHAGTIHVTDVVGALNLSTNMGAIDVQEEQFANNIHAHTNMGAVSIFSQQTPKNVSYRAQTNLGSVDVNLPGAQMQSGGRADQTGTVGQGGPMIDASSNMGAIRIGIQ